MVQSWSEIDESTIQTLTRTLGTSRAKQGTANQQAEERHSARSLDSRPVGCSSG